MPSLIRQRILSRWLGDGLSGALGASLIGWGVGKIREGLRRQPEVLDVSRLVPGETYTIVTLPPPRRRERKLAKRVKRAERKAGRALRAKSPSQRQQRRIDSLAATRAALEGERSAALARARRRQLPRHRRTFS